MLFKHCLLHLLQTARLNTPCYVPLLTPSVCRSCVVIIAVWGRDGALAVVLFVTSSLLSSVCRWVLSHVCGTSEREGSAADAGYPRVKLCFSQIYLFLNLVIVCYLVKYFGSFDCKPLAGRRTVTFGVRSWARATEKFSVIYLYRELPVQNSRFVFS